MEKEHWDKWKPTNEFPMEIWLHSLVQDRSGLQLIFEGGNENTSIVVKFGYSALSYRVTDEGDLLQTIDFWSNEYGEDFFSWPLYKSRNSSFISWFNEESCGKFEDELIEHYVFITPNEVVEVLSAIPPKVIFGEK